MKRIYLYRALCLLLPAALCLGACQQEELFEDSRPGALGEGMALRFSSDPMQEYTVTTRSSDAKENDEKEIHSLHIFFFTAEGDWLTGSYLTGYTGMTGAITEGGYIAPSRGSTLLKIDQQGFTTPADAQSATVYAVANVEPSLFRELDSNGRPTILDVEGKTPKEALEALVYKPEQFIFTTLPETGMPMAGSKVVDLTDSGEGDVNAEKRTVLLKALMARIDVNLKIDSEISEGNLPSLLLTEWKAYNLPTQVAFTTAGDGGTTALTEESKTERSVRGTQYIYNRQNSIALSFYMFENVQQPQKSITYPADIEDYQKQRYKPELANENAAYIEFNTQYTTYNNATYTVYYTLYLGANHTNDFEVRRNHQYKNNITIKGLTSQETVGDGSKYTYDARVNIEDETDNKYYISMLRERNHDAHFCVTPMDVYLFAPASVSPSMTVEFVDNTDMTADNNPWIRMEKVPAENMQNGTLPFGWTTDDHLIAGEDFTAGHGKRKYFTTDLVTNTLAETGKRVEITANRDRVYFYIDENLSDSQERTATVRLTYYEGDQVVSTRTLDIVQTYFRRVDVREEYKRYFGLIELNSYYRDVSFYMEAYEEYLDHYDPLDNHHAEQMFSGLPWGLSGVDISDVKVRVSGLWYEGDIAGQIYYDQTSNETIKSEDNYYQGLEFTNAIMEDQGLIVKMNLNSTPESAVEYCFNRNKRNTKGEVDEADRKYFLPGIRQMEKALSQYYQIYGEFQDNFYWSSSAGKTGRNGVYQDLTRARATRINRYVAIDEDNNRDLYIESNENKNYEDFEYTNTSGDYTGGGSTLRTGVNHRIRAFRVDLNPVE